MLQQNFTGYSKIDNLIKSQISALGITESNGFELLRLIRKEFSLLSRSEALGYRDQCIKFRVRKSDHLLDIVREVQTEIGSFHSFFLLLAAKVRSSCEEGPGQSALQSAYHDPQLDVTELKQHRTT